MKQFIQFISIGFEVVFSSFLGLFFGRVLGNMIEVSPDSLGLIGVFIGLTIVMIQTVRKYKANSE